MKIGILTQPLHNSPGGILQAFALQTILARLGHEAWIVRRDVNRFSWKWWMRRQISCVLNKLKGKEGTPYLNRMQWNEVNKNTHFFIDKYLNPKTAILPTNRMLKREIKHKKFDAYIVGSDQVWRPSYSPKITNYFLDFLGKADNAKRIAYAASFGVDTWEFSKRQTKKCRDLIRLFHLISVREKSGIALCENYFDVKATQVLDPTLLLSKEDYEELLHRENEKTYCGELLCFILDQTREKEDIIRQCALKTKFTPFYVMPKLSLTNRNLKNLKDCVFPSITYWLKGFVDAKFVVTDSFHGTVFAIIFNKPFVVIGNESRGISRIQSLLEIFNLQDRFVGLEEDIAQMRLFDIDWEKVNGIRQKMKDESLQYLIKALK